VSAQAQVQQAAKKSGTDERRISYNYFPQEALSLYAHHTHIVPPIHIAHAGESYQGVCIPAFPHFDPAAVKKKLPQLEWQLVRAELMIFLHSPDKKTFFLVLRVLILCPGHSFLSPFKKKRYILHKQQSTLLKKKPLLLQGCIVTLPPSTDVSTGLNTEDWITR
jgi:hypothetical protein